MSQTLKIEYKTRTKHGKGIGSNEYDDCKECTIMEEAIHLSDEQQQITKTDGNSIVVSNPGTGKTTTLSLKVVKLLEDGVDPDDILCITFTRKAKKEMYDAINRQGKSKFTALAKKVHIHTFHGFAHEHLLDSGKVDEVIVNENYIRYSIYKSFKNNKAFNYGREYMINTIVPAAATAIKYIKNFGVTPDKISIPEVSALLEQVYNDYPKSTRYTIEEVQAFFGYFVKAYKYYEESKQDAADYTDILIRFLDEFNGSLFKHALIDEMQDMNEMQAKIAERVADNIFLVGDEKQAIFGFQGGSTRHLKSFQKKCTELQLSTNRRSTNQILDYAKQYYLDKSSNDEKTRKNLEEFRSNELGEVPVVIITEDPYSNMLKLIKENPAKRIGILTRTNGQIVQISKILDAKAIPHEATASKNTTNKAKEQITSFLEGLLYDDIKYKIQAALTIFSPYPLDEALRLGKMLDMDRKGDASLAEIREWGCEMTADRLDQLFVQTIFPICVAHGREWFVTAISIKQNIDQYLTFDSPTRDELFEYLAICTEPEADLERVKRDDDDDSKKNGEGGITISTVHKAKGREYDVVIYLPKDPKSNKTAFIDIVNTAILLYAGISISDELKGQNDRLHFVAFTRAREKLAVITDGQDFNVKGLCEVVEDESEEDEGEGESAAATDRKYEIYKKAYSMFVAGKLKESRDLLDQKDWDGWVEKHITDYFEGLQRLSYSGIKAEASEFLKRIFVIPHAKNKSMEFGSIFHKAMHDILSKGMDVEKWEQDYSTNGMNHGGIDQKLKKSIQNALDAIEMLGSKYQNFKVYKLEKKIECPVSGMTRYDRDDIMFSGKIDVIFKHDYGYVIIDYKTDKSINDLSYHRKQPAAYKKMLSLAEDIPENKIETHIIFTTITGGINTGKIDGKTKGSSRSAYTRFEKDLQKVLEWKQDSSKFIDDLLKENPDMESPYDAIIESLKQARAG